MVGKPILFSGIGEKLDALEPFYPDRLASSILGMGDVLSLIDKVQQNVEQKEAARLSRLFKNNSSRWRSSSSSSNRSSAWVRLAGLLEMIPGGKKLASQVDPEKAEKEMKRVEAIINSMTLKERRNPAILKRQPAPPYRPGQRHDGHGCQSPDEAVYGDEKNDAEGE